jgi:cellulose synthase/poly-beta-1,6-N-acetylglucosamine synthase-like glycosyltransferase
VAFETVIELLVITTAVIAITYLLLVNTTYVTLTAIAIRQLRRQMRLDTYEPVGDFRGNQFVPGVAIVVPAYNEEEVIVDTVSALRSLEYPNYEVILVNDGSTDETLESLREAFEFTRVDAEYPVDLQCERVRGIYRDSADDLVLIDKENGGKADALNAGLYFTDKPLFCSVDADSLIERGALADVVEPFMTRPDETVATGGAVRIANGCTFRNGTLSDIKLPENRLVRFQVVEYLRAFLLGRIGLSNLGSLLIISGAFGMFKTELIRELGGYDTESITEDMELVVRLHLHLQERDEPYNIVSLPRPVAWTEAPESLSALSRQRRRWFRGLLDTLVQHRGAIGRPSHGVVGMFALPFYLVIEAIGPLVEGSGYLVVPLFFIAGVLSFQFFVTFLLIAVGFGSVLTLFSVFGEVVTYRRYGRPREVLTLFGYAVLENVTYRPWRAFVRWHGLFEFLRGDRSWGEMRRSGAADTEES